MRIAKTGILKRKNIKTNHSFKNKHTTHATPKHTIVTQQAAVSARSTRRRYCYSTISFAARLELICQVLSKYPSLCYLKLFDYSIISIVAACLMLASLRLLSRSLSFVAKIKLHPPVSIQLSLLARSVNKLVVCSYRALPHDNRNAFT